MSKASQDAARPPFNQVLSTLPSPLTIALVGLGSYIGHVRHLLEIFRWKSSWEESWLALGCWWAVCLCSDVALRFGLPVILCGVIVFLRWTRHPNIPSTPTTEDTLHQAMSDLTTIYALVPSLSTTLYSANNLTLQVLIRTLAFTYIPYLALTYFVRLRIIIAITGTIILTWHARWALLTRRAFWRSAYIRWSAYHLWCRISGQPLPAPISSFEDSSTALSSTSPQHPVHVLRFLFTVYENQRWWMGLDFTAALLPGERPSWCTSNLQPVSPPAAFSLPTPTTVYLPDPTRKNGKIKRTAQWTWEEPEWKVSVRKDVFSSVTRVEKPVPSLQDESTASTSASRILKAAGKMRQASISDTSPERQRKEGGEDEGEVKPDRGEEAIQEDPCTDSDGWVYGDNKWEGGSAKGGIGKYTRYRRWTRVALLTETVEYIEADELGVHADKSPAMPIHSVPTLSPASTASSDHHIPLSPALSPVSVSTQGSSTSPVEDDRSRLRRRLKEAVRGGSISNG